MKDEQSKILCGSKTIPTEKRMRVNGEELLNDIRMETDRLRAAKKDSILASEWVRSDDILLLIKLGTKVGISRRYRPLVQASEVLSRLFSELLVASLENPESLLAATDIAVEPEDISNRLSPFDTKVTNVGEPH